MIFLIEYPWNEKLSLLKIHDQSLVMDDYPWS